MTTADLEPQARAEAASKAMYARDVAVRKLGVTLLKIGPGYARMTMPVRDDMVNGHDIGHGGLTFTLADAAMAYACNSHNHIAVAQSASINFISPSRKGDVLTAVAQERSLHGRTGIYDVTVDNQDGETIAVFRGVTIRLNGAVTDAAP